MTRKIIIFGLLCVFSLAGRAEEKLYHDEAVIQKAREGLEKEIPVAKADPTRPVFHLMPEARWMNDPNGAFYEDGWYHVFYQHNPYGNRWGHMHWGHARSRDNVYWERLPVGNWPDYDKGEDHCYSGSAVKDGNGKWQLWYTSVSKVREKDQAKGKLAWVFNGQVMLKSMDKDYIKWGKVTDDPVNKPTLPNNIDGYAWNNYIRDPAFFKADGRQFMILGITGTKQSGGNVVPIYEAQNKELTKWKYRGKMFDKIWDCPQMITFGDDFVYLYNRNYAVGSFDPDTAKFTLREGVNVRSVDHSGNLYALSYSVNDKKEVSLYAWIKGMKEAKGWQGCISLPRRVSLNDKGEFIQVPVPELKKLRADHTQVKVDGDSKLVTESDTVEIVAEFKNVDKGACGLKIHGLDIRYSNNVLDAFGKKIGISPEGNDKTLSLQVFVDKCVVEIFVQNGKETITRVVYPDDKACKVEAYTEADVVGTVDAWQMKSIW